MSIDTTTGMSPPPIDATRCQPSPSAISGIIVVGAILQIGLDSVAVSVLAFIGILVASINVFGGFRVTARMLEMFKREEPAR